MSKQLKRARQKLAGLPVVRWGLWRDKRWQYTSLWSGAIWLLNTALLHWGVGKWGHGLLILIAQNIFWDSISYVANRKCKFFWGDRKVSTISSGGWTLAISVFAFAYHKAATILLVTFLGMGIIDARLLQGTIGVLENPLRYLFNNRVAFPETQEKTEGA